MPIWFPWILVGGIVFVILSFIGAKYKDNIYKKQQFFQDFISGSILIGIIGVLMPDIFPKLDVSIPLNMVADITNTELDLQVGPPRLAGR